MNNPWIFGGLYFYQVFGISMSACFNVGTDTFASAIIAQTNGQVRRLGIKLSKVSFQICSKFLLFIFSQIGHGNDEKSGNLKILKQKTQNHLVILK
jgi:hypothetical protein